MPITRSKKKAPLDKPPVQVVTRMSQILAEAKSADPAPAPAAPEPAIAPLEPVQARLEPEDKKMSHEEAADLLRVDMKQLKKEPAYKERNKEEVAAVLAEFPSSSKTDRLPDDFIVGASKHRASLFRKFDEYFGDKVDIHSHTWRDAKGQENKAKSEAMGLATNARLSALLYSFANDDQLSDRTRFQYTAEALSLARAYFLSDFDIDFQILRAIKAFYLHYSAVLEEDRITEQMTGIEALRRLKAVAEAGEWTQAQAGEFASLIQTFDSVRWPDITARAKEAVARFQAKPSDETFLPACFSAVYALIQPLGLDQATPLRAEPWISCRIDQANEFENHLRKSEGRYILHIALDKISSGGLNQLDITYSEEWTPLLDSLIAFKKRGYFIPYFTGKQRVKLTPESVNDCSSYGKFISFYTQVFSCGIREVRHAAATFFRRIHRAAYELDFFAKMMRHSLAVEQSVYDRPHQREIDDIQKILQQTGQAALLAEPEPQAEPQTDEDKEPQELRQDPDPAAAMEPREEKEQVTSEPMIIDKEQARAFDAVFERYLDLLGASNEQKELLRLTRAAWPREKKSDFEHGVLHAIMSRVDPLFRGSADS